MLQDPGHDIWPPMVFPPRTPQYSRVLFHQVYKGSLERPLWSPRRTENTLHPDLTSTSVWSRLGPSTRTVSPVPSGVESLRLMCHTSVYPVFLRRRQPLDVSSGGDNPSTSPRLDHLRPSSGCSHNYREREVDSKKWTSSQGWRRISEERGRNVGETSASGLRLP